MKIPTPQLLPSGSWFVRVRVGGESYSKTFPTRDAAEVWATLIKSKYVSGELKKKLPDEKKTIRTLVEEYTTETPLAENTLKTYRTVLNHHFKQIMNKPFEAVSNWQRVINLESQNLNPNTLTAYWRKICAALRYHDLPVPSVKIAKKTPKMKNYLEPDEIGAFCKAIKNTRYEYLFLLMLSSLRVSEALNVTENDVSEKGVYVHGTKTDAAERFVPFMIPRLKELQFVPVQTTPRQLNKELKKICAENGFPDLSCHSLRVSFASVCYSKNVPSRVVMKIAGWIDIQTMHRVYVRISENDVEKWTAELENVFIDNSLTK